MRKTIDLDTLITATVTGVICDDNSIHITARSLMGKYRSYLIAIEGNELTVTGYAEVAEDEKKEEALLPKRKRSC